MSQLIPTFFSGQASLSVNEVLGLVAQDLSVSRKHIGRVLLELTRNGTLVIAGKVKGSKAFKYRLADPPEESERP